ncbi:L-ascorbate metabolism protein UlaG, beta-lactamase superfamily [Noviherbaspirillum humi]|uniref:L-ascorbate metabolism protein UlaG, beta-lactamase superfamily n=1 Tax=Noviherbaspirillum humi TaxID=1688639 RepID=A0A239GH28_9BURK|nr:MBL fold metallo-hydrolase [Noviherbaspirillum humi]SNS68351.1 L-ascorbate metabolism protein UlaG, beta-lactamase superfamily [Noviherbaspirillum humi]
MRRLAGAVRLGRAFLKRHRLACLAAAVALAGFGCATRNPYFDPAKPHHTETGFRNNYMQGPIGGSFLTWQWERLTEGLPKPPANGYRFPLDKPDIAWLKANRSETTLTWIGHASTLLQLNGVNVLTDPIFSERASPFSFLGPQRKVPPGLQLEELPRIDVVVISHNHYDHLDLDSVRALNAQAGGPPLFLVPLGLKPWLAEQGITHARELDWWDKTNAGGIDVTMAPVQHWSARGLTDRFKTLWGGWIFNTAAGAAKPFSVFFAGDTGYSRDFADIGKKFKGFDLALLPVGAYEPRWFMHNQHVNPEEAVKIHRDIQARQSIGIHWGTFELTDEPLDEPPKVLAQEVLKAKLPPEQFRVLRHGEMVKF